MIAKKLTGLIVLIVFICVFAWLATSPSSIWIEDGAYLEYTTDNGSGDVTVDRWELREYEISDRTYYDTRHYVNGELTETIRDTTPLDIFRDYDTAGYESREVTMDTPFGERKCFEYSNTDPDGVTTVKVIDASNGILFKKTVTDGESTVTMLMTAKQGFGFNGQ